MTGGGSSYPLANILAAANAEKAASAAAAAAALAAQTAASSASLNGEGNHAKKQRRNGSAAFDDDDEEEERVKDKADLLWELDLDYPAPTPSYRGGGGKGSKTPNRSSNNPSLPHLAWRRILERAQRGVGDASYESDDESVAMDEARDERPRVELARVLKSLRQVRTTRGEITKI
jgi:hypothetical protein